MCVLPLLKPYKERIKKHCSYFIPPKKESCLSRNGFSLLEVVFALIILSLTAVLFVPFVGLHQKNIDFIQSVYTVQTSYHELIKNEHNTSNGIIPHITWHDTHADVDMTNITTQATSKLKQTYYSDTLATHTPYAVYLYRFHP